MMFVILVLFVVGLRLCRKLLLLSVMIIVFILGVSVQVMWDKFFMVVLFDMLLLIMVMFLFCVVS